MGIMTGSHNLLVVGAGSGIGEAFVDYQFDQRQRGRDPWEQVFTPLKDEMDVAYDQSVSAYIMQHGPFGGIVYSAGVDRLDWLGQTDMNDVREVLSVNLIGIISIVDAHIRFWPDTEVDVVIVGSDAAERPMRTSTAYCASKAAVHMAARVMARELGPKGWHVNVVAPGMTDETGMQQYVDARVPEIRGWTPEAALAYEKTQEVIPGRIDKKEVAEVIWNTLLGPDHLNGSIITINGGR